MQQFNRKTPKTYSISTTTDQLHKHPQPIDRCLDYQNLIIKNKNQWIRKRLSNKPELCKLNIQSIFEHALQDSVDQGLSMLGNSAKEAIYRYLEKEHGINRIEIPMKIEEFTDAIEEIFGEGAKILEIQIMKHLFKKVNVKFKNYPKQNFTFTEYILLVRQSQYYQTEYQD